MSAPALEVVELSDYAPHIACSPLVTVLFGQRIALVLDSAAGDVAARGRAAAGVDGSAAGLVSGLEALLRAFDACVGRVPSLAAPLRGRVRVEVAFLPGAAGLAHHGVAGIAVGPAFVEQCLGLYAAGRPTLHHVFCYEFCRNYIFPEEFTAVFDYCCLEGAASWGWVNQGFINVLGALLVADMPGVAFDYHGFTLEQFLGQMEADLAAYRDGGHAWDAAFLHDRLPWAAGRSLDNLYSGLLVYLWRRFGRGVFLRRWFRGAIPLLLARCPASKADVATARDNFFLAASYAARADLTPLFRDALRWPIGADVAAHALEFVLDAARADPTA